MNSKKKNKTVLKFMSVTLATVLTVGTVSYSNELSVPSNIIRAFAYDIGNYQVNTSSGLKVRSAANTSSSVLCAAPNGTSFYVEKTDGDWGYTSSISGYSGDTLITKSGWVYLNYCSYISPPSSGYSTGRYKVNTSSGVNVRSEANTNSSKLCAAPNGTLFDVIQVSNGWGYSNSIEGWVGDNLTKKSGWVSLQYCEYLGPLETPAQTTAPPPTTTAPPPTTTAPPPTTTAPPPTTTALPPTTTTLPQTTIELTTSSTLSVETLPPSYGSNTNFTFGKDNYSFLNKENYFHSDYYKISDKYKKYFSNVNNKSWENIKYYTENTSNGIKWSGSCYGLSCVQILTKAGLIDVSDIQPDVKNLYDLSAPKDNEEVESIINFYHLQQYTDTGSVVLKSMVGRMSNKERVNKVIELAKEAQNGGMPALLVFNFSSNKSRRLNNAHAVVIYGIEYGDWIFESCGDRYDCRILISDSNVKGFNEDYCLYIDTENYYWEIPYYDKNGMGYCTNKNSVNNSFAAIQYVTNDLSYIDQLHYVSGGKNIDEKQLYSSISINTPDNTFGVSYYDEKNTGINSDSIELVYFGSSVNGGNEDTISAILPEADVAYQYDAKDTADFNTAVDYTNSRLRADIKNGSYAVYIPDESIEFYGENSEYELSMIMNENYHPTDWYKITVSGNNTDKASLTVTDKGYVLKSDNLNDGVFIEAANRDKSANLNLSTSYESVLIYEINDSTLGIKVDTDGDGIFETRYIPSYLGDANQDGMVSIADAVLLQKYLLNQSSISKMQYIAADYNMDGQVNIFDMVSLKKKLAYK